MDRVPGLIVLRPRHLTDGTPDATQLRLPGAATASSQAVRDALYKGPTTFRTTPGSGSRQAVDGAGDGPVAAQRRPGYARGMKTGFEALEHYLHDGSRRGPAPEGAFSGAAGGAPCGDLVRISLAVEGGRVAAARFDAEGCAAAIAAGAAAAEPAEGASVLDAARIGPAEISAALGGLSPQGRHAAELAADALHRALGAAASSGEALADPPAGGGPRSGGDERRRRLRRRGAARARRGAEVVAVTLKLWADRHTDGARSCCSPEAVVGARALAHGLGLPHLTLDLEDAFRATVVDGLPARPRGGADARTPAWSATARCGSTRCSPSRERLGAAALATGHYARVADDGAGPLLAAPADAAKDQTYMLSALRPESLARLRFPLAELTKPQVARARRARRASGRHQAREPGPLLPRRRGKALLPGAARAPRRAARRDRRRRAGWWGATAGHHNFTVGQRRGLGVAAGAPLYVLATDAAANRVVVGPRAALATCRCAFATRCCSATAIGSTGSSSATGRARSAAPSRAPQAATPSCARTWRSPPTASRPARPPA